MSFKKKKYTAERKKNRTKKQTANEKGRREFQPFSDTAQKI